MKIAVCLYPINDLGGIINHTEELIGGFKNLGHEVDLLEMVWKTSVKGQRKDTCGRSWSKGPSGILHHQGKGWNFPVHNRVAYKGNSLKWAKQKLERYDLIVWNIPVPTKIADHRGNDDWPELYDLDHPKQVAVVHDGNAFNGCAHIQFIQEFLHGVACVHSCAFNGASFLTAPRAMIVNPQNLEGPKGYPNWEHKKSGFVSMQTFKAWKHVHELVEAIAYMPVLDDGEQRLVAGEGIEYQYMKSLEKCKPAYFHKHGRLKGQRMWETALNMGMQRPPHGYLTAEEATATLLGSRVLVDPSWSAKYTKVGGHWNRTVVDAIRCGAIPVAQRRGMGDELFQADEHYIPLEAEFGPEEYAAQVLSVGLMGSVQAHKYQAAGQELLTMFDRDRVAQQYIDLAHGNHKATVGEGDAYSADKCDDILSFFNL
jgi:glycosyltransferase involved in cell wall biosynthesis